MGYNTDFNGELKIEPVLKPEDKLFLERFSNSRHMKRDVVKTIELFGQGNYGVEGEWFLDDKMNPDHTPDIVNYNCPPSTQPGLWCDFCPNEEGTALVWNGNEKTYDGLEWITYLVTNYLAPRGYVVNGRLDAFGEERGDVWAIVVKDNVVKHQLRGVVDVD